MYNYSFISFYEMCQVNRYSTRLRPMGHNSLKNMLLKIIDMNYYPAPQCVTPFVCPHHNIYELMLHLSKIIGVGTGGEARWT